jgi:uncharacterized membrane protein
MQEFLKTAIGVLVPLVEACGVLVIVIGVVRGLTRYVVGLFKRAPGGVRRLRMRLAESMVMGIEFQVAADILKTTLSTKWNDLLQLAALIGLRTLLNYLMERELRMLDDQQAV